MNGNDTIRIVGFQWGYFMRELWGYSQHSVDGGRESIQSYPIYSRSPHIGQNDDGILVFPQHIFS